MIIKIGVPPFPAKQIEFGCVAKIEHIWHSARRYAKLKGYVYDPSYGVVDVAPT